MWLLAVAAVAAAVVVPPSLLLVVQWLRCHPPQHWIAVLRQTNVVRRPVYPADEAMQQDVACLRRHPRKHL